MKFCLLLALLRAFTTALPLNEEVAVSADTEALDVQYYNSDTESEWLPTGLNPSLGILHQVLVRLGQRKESSLSATLELLDKYIPSRGLNIEFSYLGEFENSTSIKHTMTSFEGLKSKLDANANLSANSPRPMTIPAANAYIYAGSHSEAPKVLLVSFIGDDWGHDSPLAGPYVSPASIVPYYKDVDRIYGTGAASWKSSVATMIHTMERLVKLRKIAPEDLGVLLVAGDGSDPRPLMHASKLFEDKLPAAIIIGEASENRLLIGQKGFLWAGVKTYTDTDKHMFSFMNKGNAVSTMVKLLRRLETLRLSRSRILGNPTTTISYMTSGIGRDEVAESAESFFSVRIPAGFNSAVKKINSIFSGSKLVEYSVKSLHPPLIFVNDIPSMKKDISGSSIDYTPLIYPERNDRPVLYAYGPGNLNQANTDHEYINRVSLVQAASDYEYIILHALKTHYHNFNFRAIQS
ncbi:hypothetical protein CANCADRAFT_32430 [Tortispora caseinolytica NRRL Y-17796]|uniref:Peptide hydrolase n=1 Tax=Tortispora caseinolytica NRRL Y-17796 TaxID=767744 RepID=A0A1E4TBB3_9ASCO|nr:hypothetical protein CANCADRAFT_32430 [Tortispora caseinolytica NRRL Y-17796]